MSYTSQALKDRKQAGRPLPLRAARGVLLPRLQRRASLCRLHCTAAATAAAAATVAAAAAQGIYLPRLPRAGHRLAGAQPPHAAGRASAVECWWHAACALERCAVSRPLVLGGAALHIARELGLVGGAQTAACGKGAQNRLCT